MKTLALAAALAAFTAAPAFATKITVQFASDAGDVVTVVFDDEAMTVTTPEGSAPYTVTPETKTLCATDAEGEYCVTMAELPEAPAVGFSTSYETNRGSSGEATIIAIE